MLFIHVKSCRQNAKINKLIQTKSILKLQYELGYLYMWENILFESYAVNNELKNLHV